MSLLFPKPEKKKKTRSWGGIKRSPADALFSELIRTRDDWTCQRCHRSRPHVQIDCAHCFTRGAKSTRWDQDNAIGLCRGCHLYLDIHADEKFDLFISRIGQSRFDALRMRSKIPMKVDEEMMKIVLKAELKRVKAEKGEKDFA